MFHSSYFVVHGFKLNTYEYIYIYTYILNDMIYSMNGIIYIYTVYRDIYILNVEPNTQ